MRTNLTQNELDSLTITPEEAKVIAGIVFYGANATLIPRGDSRTLLLQYVCGIYDKKEILHVQKLVEEITAVIPENATVRSQKHLTHADRQLLAKWAKTGVQLRMGEIVNHESYVADVQARFGDLSAPWLKLYPPTDLTAAVFDAYRDSEFGWRMTEMAHAANRAGTPAYLYYFAHRPPYGAIMRGMPIGAGKRQLGAHHAAEIPYVFGNMAVLPGAAGLLAKERQLSDLMQDYWVRFAATGNPNGGAGPDWPAFEAKKRRFLRFDTATAQGSDLLAGSWELHKEIDRRRSRAGLASDGAYPGLLGRSEPAGTDPAKQSPASR